MKNHFWCGSIISETELSNKLENLSTTVAEQLRESLKWDELLDGLEKFSNALMTDVELSKELSSSGLNEIEIKQTLSEMSKFCQRNQLLNKWKRELGDDQAPFDLKRVNFESNNFEAWKPLGVLTHILPGNAFGLSLLATIEGLLSGNFNIVKLSSKESDFSIKGFKLLSEVAPLLTKKIIALKVSSKDEHILDKILSVSDGVSAWGGDNAIVSLRNKLSAQTRFIPWGHKISLAYVSKSSRTDIKQLSLLADDIILNEQQACSSPQTALVEADSIEELNEFASHLITVLAEKSSKTKRAELSLQEKAEITNQVEIAKLEEFYQDTKVFEAPDRSTRIIVENKAGLRPSPLFRTLIVRRAERNEIIAQLANFRSYLQTASLICIPSEEMEITDALLKAGITRITLPGKMLESYEGEPHDGVYALPRFMKRVRVELKEADGIFRPEVKLQEAVKKSVVGKIMTKADFQSNPGHPEVAKYYFKSGGSTGQAALSTFSYRDYHHQMQAAAEGLLAAGLNPAVDRCVNLFFGGGLYGGFLSFTTILEKLEAVQFPMSAHEDLTFVGDIIVDQKINTLLGMPSYLIQLLKHNADKFKKSKVITKLFYGGEHFSPEQRQWLNDEFNIRVVRSASYGSVDAGPLGFQCPFIEGGIHHLNDQLHYLEILKSENDDPVEGQEVGRLIFTTKHRDAVDIKRYEIGDLGRWVEGACRCGRKTPRFELMGRMGDVFRVAGTFINLQRISKILGEKTNYQGEIQAVISQEQLKDKLELRLDRDHINDNIQLESIILKAYPDLEEVIYKEKNLNFLISKIDSKAFERTLGSGKLKRVIDLRNRS